MWSFIELRNGIVNIIRYRDLREPPWMSNKYDRSADFWYILAARLTFVLIFQNVVALVTMLIGWCIPDVPRKLSERIRQEAYLTNEIIIKQEMIRARGAHAAQAVKGDATAWNPHLDSNGPLAASRNLSIRRSKSSGPRMGSLTPTAYDAAPVNV